MAKTSYDSRRCHDSQVCICCHPVVDTLVFLTSYVIVLNKVAHTYRSLANRGDKLSIHQYNQGKQRHTNLGLILCHMLKNPMRNHFRIPTMPRSYKPFLSSAFRFRLRCLFFLYYRFQVLRELILHVPFAKVLHTEIISCFGNIEFLLDCEIAKRLAKLRISIIIKLVFEAFLVTYVSGICLTLVKYSCYSLNAE